MPSASQTISASKDEVAGVNLLSAIGTIPTENRLVVAGRDVKIFEYTPLEIKKSVVGYGRATKDQIRAMVKVILNLKKQLGPDSSDALAAAICHINWTRFEK